VILPISIEFIAFHSKELSHLGLRDPGPEIVPLLLNTSVRGRPIKANNVTDLVWSWHGENSEPWRTGDLLAHELLARVYAAYLESAWPCRRGEL
jgi:hypothetical protein